MGIQRYWVEGPASCPKWEQERECVLFADHQREVERLRKALMSARAYAVWKRDHAQTPPAMKEAARGIEQIDAALAQRRKRVMEQTPEQIVKAKWPRAFWSGGWACVYSPS